MGARRPLTMCLRAPMPRTCVVEERGGSERHWMFKINDAARVRSDPPFALKVSR